MKALILAIAIFDTVIMYCCSTVSTKAGKEI